MTGASALGDAQITLALARTGSPQQALSQFLGQQGITVSGTSSAPINGLTAAVGTFSAALQDGTSLAGYAAFIQLDGTTYRLLTITPAQLMRNYDGALCGTIGSFARSSDPAKLAVKPARVALVTLPGRYAADIHHQRDERRCDRTRDPTDAHASTWELDDEVAAPPCRRWWIPEMDRVHEHDIPTLPSLPAPARPPKRHCSPGSRPPGLRPAGIGIRVAG